MAKVSLSLLPERLRGEIEGMKRGITRGLMMGYIG